MKKTLALTVLAAGFWTLLAAQGIDREKLQNLHRSGKALEEALANPGSTPAEIRELCRKVDIEAQKVEHGITTKEEKYVYDLYSTAAGEYVASLDRFEKHHSRTRFEAELTPVREYLRLADDTYNGRPHEVKPSPPPAPVAPPASVPPAPLPAPPPPMESLPPSAAPAPSAAATPPPPAAVARVEPPAPPAAVPPSVPPAPLPAPPPPVEKAPPPSVPNPPPAAPPRPAPQSTPRSSSIADASPNAIRKAANKVRIEKKEDAIRPCQFIGEISISGNSDSGVYEINGHNFYYGSDVELARFKTVEAGGDTIYLKSTGKAVFAASAYRCVEFR